MNQPGILYLHIQETAGHDLIHGFARGLSSTQSAPDPPRAHKSPSKEKKKKKKKGKEKRKIGVAKTRPGAGS